MAAIRPFRPGSRSRPGFTLIELMLVVVIVGALLSVAIPSVGKQVGRDRVQRSAMVVQGMLDEASQLAARRRSPVTVTLSSGTLRINDRASGAAIKSRSFGPTQDLKATLSFNPSAGITIFPTGRSSAGLRITLAGSGDTVVVSRTAAGIVRRN